MRNCLSSIRRKKRTSIKQELKENIIIEFLINIIKGVANLVKCLFD